MSGYPNIVGAPFASELAWNAIDWHSSRRTVRRLQAHIVKAVITAIPPGSVNNWAFVRLELLTVKMCAVVRIEKFLIQLGEVQSK